MSTTVNTTCIMTITPTDIIDAIRTIFILLIIPILTVVAISPVRLLVLTCLRWPVQYPARLQKLELA